MVMQKSEVGEVENIKDLHVAMILNFGSSQTLTNKLKSRGRDINKKNPKFELNPERDSNKQEEAAGNCMNPETDATNS